MPDRLQFHDATWFNPEEHKMQATSSPEFFRAADLIRQGVVPFSKATLHRRVADGTFPQPVKVSPRVTAWPRAAIEAWLAKVQK